MLSVAMASVALSLALMATASDDPGQEPRLVNPTASRTVGTAAWDAVPAATGRWRWPLAEPVRLVRDFRAPTQRWLPGHRGVDLLTGVGEPVLAPADAVVSFVGSVAGRGVLTLTHADGLRSSFEPVRSSLRVGDRVSQGHPAALVTAEAGHCPPQTCLHWGVRRGSDYLDPLSLIQRRPTVLLPLHE